MLLGVDEPCSDGDGYRFDPRPDPELCADLLKVAVDGARRQADDSPDVGRALSATDPSQAFGLARAEPWQVRKIMMRIGVHLHLPEHASHVSRDSPRRLRQ